MAEVGRRALLLSIGALALTMLLPALGLALGVFSIVVSLRAWRRLTRGRGSVVMPALGLLISVAAVAIGASVLWVQLYFSGELSAYTECMKGAGTSTSQQACVSRLEQSIEHRLPFMPKGSIRLPIAP
ncbi:hypothetical protein [Sphaerisporangium fuscum]|uniref:hypothetical protein n=1 Tax=Sphaerisporangium fuscum TaxID=2835868 RepID=UPI001BDCD2A3|nr:hypothetical protein [Sphaerisporangium fuscum]